MLRRPHQMEVEEDSREKEKSVVHAVAKMESHAATPNAEAKEAFKMKEKQATAAVIGPAVKMEPHAAPT